LWACPERPATDGFEGRRARRQVMDTVSWVVLVGALIVGAIVVAARSRQTRAEQAQDRRMGVQRAGGAHSPAEEISQREDRRLGGMSAEDRAWETASLERNREREAPAPRATDTDASP
jgi:hypothetical protein